MRKFCPTTLAVVILIASGAAGVADSASSTAGARGQAAQDRLVVFEMFERDS